MKWGQILVETIFKKKLKNNIISSAYRSFITTAHNKSKLSFDGQTAIITGAGQGLGKEYAKLFASRGANVVVNDPGVLKSGDLGNLPVAEATANEITSKFGKTNNRIVPDTSSVDDFGQAQSLIDKTIRMFGRIDILINNAGILRDRSFNKMTIEDWELVHRVHLTGSFHVTKACWPHMKKQSYGRIIMTSSTSGLFGNFGQANYSAAKLGLIGLTNSLAIEGARDNIFTNTVVPMAVSRMTENILPEAIHENFKPEYVAPLVAWLCHKSNNQNGQIFEAAGRCYGRYKLVRSEGCYIDLNGPEIDDTSIEKIESHRDKIADMSRQFESIEDFQSHIAGVLSMVGKH